MVPSTTVPGRVDACGLGGSGVTQERKPIERAHRQGPLVPVCLGPCAGRGSDQRSYAAARGKANKLVWGRTDADPALRETSTGCALTLIRCVLRSSDGEAVCCSKRLCSTACSAKRIRAMPDAGSRRLSAAAGCSTRPRSASSASASTRRVLTSSPEPAGVLVVAWHRARR